MIFIRFFGLLLISFFSSLIAEKNIAPLSNHFTNGIDALDISFVPTKDTNPFTYNLNPFKKYLKLFLFILINQKKLEGVQDLIKIKQKGKKRIEKLPYSKKNADLLKDLQVDIDKIIESSTKLSQSIEKATSARKAVIAGIHDHFEQLFDPATGILN